MISIILTVFLFQGCGGTVSESTNRKIGTVNVLGVWDGDEFDSFQAMIAPWEKQTGGTMVFSGTRDLISLLTTRVIADNPPDVAILPNPGQMVELAKEGEIVALNSFLDMKMINQQYAQGWIDLGTIDGNLYGIFMKADSKSTIWYNPKTFSANGWEIPKTWDEMITLSDRIVSEGSNPWSIAMESAEASGWPATDWIGEILIHESGGDVYDQWINHQIPWTDSMIKSAWGKFGLIVSQTGYVSGGINSVLATNFIDGSYLPFENPPKAAMYHLGAFTQGFICQQFPDLIAGEDYAFFPFPTIDPQYSGAVTGGANVVVVFNDNPTTRSFVEYLVSAEAQQIWIKRGGFTSVNMKVNPDAYTNPLARLAAEQLTNATIFRFDADDNMPPRVQKAFWAGILTYLQDQSQLDSILTNIETIAIETYEQ